MDGGAGEKSASSASQGTSGALTLLLEELAASPEGEAAQAWAEALYPGNVLDGRFEILRELGRGGFGAVYEAFDRELGRRVALKTLRPGRARDEWADEQLKKEAQAAASLSHPGIVTLFEACTCGRGPYLVMELLHGETLDERLFRGPLSPAEAVEVGLQASRALAHVHAHGLVHRDLKPGNLLLGEDGRVKLLDLGLAHLLGRKGSTGGTPAYVAPEQWRGEPVDGRADVFSLGAVLYEALCGRRPFEVKEERSTALDPGPAPALEGDAPRALAALVARCLAKDPKARPTAAQVAEELLAVQRAMGANARRRWARFALVLAGVVIVAAGVHSLVVRRTGTESSTTAAPAAPPSIAVLPFADMSPGKDQEYFADGVAEEIINALAQVQGLKVIGRTSSFSFKGKNEDLRTIGQRLGVAALLEGSVRKEGNRLRISAQLVRAADGSQLWSQVFDRAQIKVFAVQEEIARGVVDALRVKLLAGQAPSTKWMRTANSEAYNQYLLGQQLRRPGSVDGYRRALAAYEKALALDREYAPAWAGVADALALIERMSDDFPDPERKRSALAAAERAIALAPDLAEAHFSRALVRRELTSDREGALADVERALSLKPNFARAEGFRARLLDDAGRGPEAVAAAIRATELDPLEPWLWTHLGVVYDGAGESSRAREAYMRTLEISPEHEFARRFLARHLLKAGKASEALAVIQRARPGPSRLFLEAIIQHDLGNAAASQVALDTLVARHSGAWAYQIAEIHAQRGEPDAAFEWLEVAREQAAKKGSARQADTGLDGIEADPFLRKLQDDPRWKRFLRKMSLPVE